MSASTTVIFIRPWRSLASTADFSMAPPFTKNRFMSSPLYHPAFRPEHRSDVARLIDLAPTICETLDTVDLHCGRTPSLRNGSSGQTTSGRSKTTKVTNYRPFERLQVKAVADSGQSEQSPRGLQEQELYELALDPLRRPTSKIRNRFKHSRKLWKISSVAERLHRNSLPLQKMKLH